MTDNASIAAQKINAHFTNEGVVAEVKDGKLVITVADLQVDPGVRESIVESYNNKRKDPNIGTHLTRGIVPAGPYTILSPKQQLLSDGNTIGRLHRVENILHDMLGNRLLDAKKVQMDVVDAAREGFTTATLTVDAGLIRGDIAGYDVDAAIQARAAATSRK